MRVKKNKPICVSQKTGIKNEVDILYLICALWFAFQFVLVLICFFQIDFENHWYDRTLIFGFLLTFYWIRNIFNKMKGKIKKKKKGHLFVAVWSIFIVILFIISKVSKGKFEVPFRAWENLIYILTVFTGWKFTKIIFHLKTRGRKLLRAYVILNFLGRRTMRVYLKRQTKKARKRERDSNQPLNRKGIPYAPLKF